MEPESTAVLIDRVNDSYKHMMMVASPNGRCYLFHRQTGRISWYVETGKMFIHLAYRKDAEDYLGFKSQETNAIDWSDNNTNLYHFKPQDTNAIDWSDNNTNLYHFKPNNIPKLIPFDTEEDIQQYANHHYEDSNTKVNKTKKVYHFNHAGNKADDTSPGAAFKIEREDFYLHRSSPIWSLRFARIRAWFPGFSDQERHQPECVVYHARDSNKFIQVCNKYKLQPMPIDSPLNKLVMNLRTNLKILLPENDQIVAQGKHKTVILEDSCDGVNAILKKVRTDDDSEATKLKQKLRSTFYHDRALMMEPESTAVLIDRANDSYKHMEVLASSRGCWFNLVGGAVANGKVVKDSVLDAIRYVVPKRGKTGSYKHMMMVASPNGRCYLFHRQTGRISWYVETGEKFIEDELRQKRCQEKNKLTKQQVEKLLERMPLSELISLFFKSKIKNCWKRWKTKKEEEFVLHKVIANNIHVVARLGIGKFAREIVGIEDSNVVVEDNIQPTKLDTMLGLTTVGQLQEEQIEKYCKTLCDIEDMVEKANNDREQVVESTCKKESKDDETSSKVEHNWSVIVCLCITVIAYMLYMYLF